MMFHVLEHTQMFFERSLNTLKSRHVSADHREQIQTSFLPLSSCAGTAVAFAGTMT